MIVGSDAVQERYFEMIRLSIPNGFLGIFMLEFEQLIDIDLFSIFQDTNLNTRITELAEVSK